MRAIKNCRECLEHVVINDADPYDWFNSDDVAVACRLIPNDKKNMSSLHPADHSDFKPITVGDRPYQVKQVNPPEWCPKNK